MMKVVEEAGTSMDDYVYLKAEYLDAVYLQQDAYDEVDGATSAERQARLQCHEHNLSSDLISERRMPPDVASRSPR